jgi:nucleoside-triphosphatase THEP1
LNTNKNNVNPIWLKAAIIGSLWASIEIILGSFLHNLHTPFTGPILASIGVCLLVMTNRVWPEKGLILRAGMICAIMKSISPSAIIIGPMIGIFIESLLLEICITIFKRNIDTYIVGGALAVSTTLMQQIISLIITYGFNLIDLYIKIVNMAAKNLGADKIGPWDLILLLLLLEFSLGAFAAIIGFYAGKVALKLKNVLGDYKDIEKNNKTFSFDTEGHNFSINWLIFHFFYLTGSLFILNILNTLISSLIIIIYLLLCSIRYKKAFKRFKKPRLWIEFGALIVLSGILLGGITNHVSFWNWDGLRIGFEMTLRAVLMIIGFSSISVELRNPKIINFLLQKGMKQLYLSLEIAFDTLPIMMSILSQQKKIFRTPIITLASLISTANEIYESHITANGLPTVFILTGRSGSGKTTMLQKIVEILKTSNLKIGGILAPGFWKDGKRERFDILDIKTGEKTLLCTIENSNGKITEGPFHFMEEGLEFGSRALDKVCLDGVEFIIIDEVGRLELRGEGWAKNLDRLTDPINKSMLLVVREQLIEKVCKKWGLQPKEVWDVRNMELNEITDKLLKILNREK